MSNQFAVSDGLMEGDGAYNKHAKIQAGGAALALPFLADAVQNLALDPGHEPIVIADYGSSQGKNSLSPVRTAVQGLRKRIGPNRAITVFHIDQPSNDFNSLFRVLQEDADTYTLNDSFVYPSAIGKSFYQRVLPAETVHLGWSSYAAMWLSQLPILLPDHFIALCSKAEARKEFDRQGEKDWESFLSLRAVELHPGGRLVVVLPGVADDGGAGLEPLFDHANAVLHDMVSDGVITPEERSRMTVLTHPRPERDLLSPFRHDKEFHGLVVEESKRCELRDSAWEEYERGGDEQALVSSRFFFFRTAFLPSLARALNQSGAKNGEVVGHFSEHLEKRLRRRLAIKPVAMHTIVQIMVFAKRL